MTNRDLRRMKRQLDRFVLSRFAAWRPQILIVWIILVCIVINLLAYYLGHTTITNKIGQKLSFKYPAISLTANHNPEYIIYAVSNTILSLYILNFIHQFSALYSKCTDHVKELYAHRPQQLTDQSLDHSIEQPDNSTSYEDQPSPPPHRLAFWHDHFHQQPYPSHANRHHSRHRSPVSAATSSETSPSQRGRHHAEMRATSSSFSIENREHSIINEGSQNSFVARLQVDKLTPGCIKSRPTLCVVFALIWISLIGLIVQAVVPAQHDILALISQDCVVITPAKTLNIMESGGQTGNPGAGHTILSPANAKNNNGTENTEVSVPKLRSWTLRLLQSLRPYDPSRPALGRATGGIRTSVLSPFLPPQEGSHISCPQLAQFTPSTQTLIHAIGAVLFFVVAYAATILFTLWLLSRWIQQKWHKHSRRSLLNVSLGSIIIKAFFSLIPWTHPLDYFKDDFLQYFSLVEWNGAVQRFAVLCILAYVASLGLEISRLRETFTDLFTVPKKPRD